MMTDPLVAFLESHLDLYLTELESIVSLDSYSYDRADVNRVRGGYPIADGDTIHGDFGGVGHPSQVELPSCGNLL